MRQKQILGLVKWIRICHLDFVGPFHGYNGCASARLEEDREFASQPRHTKGVKNCTALSRGAQYYGDRTKWLLSEILNRVSGYQRFTY